MTRMHSDGGSSFDCSGHSFYLRMKWSIFYESV